MHSMPLCEKEQQKRQHFDWKQVYEEGNCKFFQHVYLHVPLVPIKSIMIDIPYKKESFISKIIYSNKKDIKKRIKRIINPFSVRDTCL